MVNNGGYKSYGFIIFEFNHRSSILKQYLNWFDWCLREVMSSERRSSSSHFVCGEDIKGEDECCVVNDRAPPWCDKKKPAIIKFYDFTKRGTYIIDQRMGYYTCKTKSRKWTVSAFSYLLDTIVWMRQQFSMGKWEGPNLGGFLRVWMQIGFTLFGKARNVVIFNNSW